MIEARELRIGNLVYASLDENDNPEPCQVTQLRNRGIVWSSDLGPNPKGENYTSYENVEPIPLTEDWLTKLGFTKIQEGDMAHPEIWRITYCRVLVETNFDLQNRDPCEYRWFEGNTNVPLYYVHDLQNLFFALSGKELTIINL